MRYLFLSEKNSTMRAVKDVYLKHAQRITQDIGVMDFVPLHGHVCRLLQPKEYSQWSDKWEKLELPMVPDTFKVGVIQEERKCLDVIRDMLSKKNYDGIIVGTDSDQEGNGIYDLIETYLGLQKYYALRFFEQSMTEQEILKSLYRMTDYHTNPRDIGMTQAYRIRSRMDWLVGYNFTVGFTIKAGFLMRVGRVKAPVMKLIYDNCMAIDRFQKHVGYIVANKYQEGFYGTLVDNKGKRIQFDKEEEARLLIGELSDSAVVVGVEKKQKKTLPAQLYELSDIQVEAGGKYGYSPEVVLQTVQSLYEKKLVSYPRTEGRYISSEKSLEVASMLKAVASIPGMKEIVYGLKQSDIDSFRSNSRYVNDVEVEKSSHDALVPTGRIPEWSKLSRQEQEIGVMIYKRFLAAFLPPIVEEKITIITKDHDYLFRTDGSRVIDLGFTRIFDRKPKELLLPDVKKGDTCHVHSHEIGQIETKPPKRLTQSTLIDAMRNIQKYIADKDMKAIMKEKEGIGRPSSRASIIKELLQTGYVSEKGRGLYITDAGKTYVENLLPLKSFDQS